jgi:hypothetical protein
MISGMVEEKGKAYLFIAQTGRYIYRFGATSDVSVFPFRYR